MRYQTIVKMCAVFVGCGVLGACATVHPQSAAEPVRVHTDGDAIAMLDTDTFKATHFKIGARWFPRCQQFASLGSRTDIQSACISKEQMQEIVENRIGQQEEFMQRTAVLNGPQGN